MQTKELAGDKLYHIPRYEAQLHRDSNGRPCAPALLPVGPLSQNPGIVQTPADIERVTHDEEGERDSLR